MRNQRAKSIEQRVKETPPPHPPLSKGGRRGGNEKGIALVMVLVLSAIALAIMAGLIYMVTSGTQISGMEKRYKTALEAGVGGADVTYQFAATMGETPYTSSLISKLSAIGPTITTPNACTGIDSWSASFSGLEAKLKTNTSTWSVGCNRSFTIDPLTNTTYDMRFDFGINPTYRVYSKIVDTVEGTTAGGELLIVPIFTPSSPPPAEHLTYLWTFELDAQNRDNPAERAKLSILYQY